VALASLLTWGYHYLANQRADVLADLPVGLRLSQSFRETDHLGAIVLSDIWMYVWQIGRSLCKTRVDFSLLLRQLPHPCLHSRLVHAILDGVENRFYTPVNFPNGASVRFCLRSPLTRP